MRYTHRASFLNQIKNAKSANALSRIYWVATSQDFERCEVVKDIIQKIGGSQDAVQKWAQLDLRELGNHLQTATLFEKEPIAVLENAEGISKADFPFLERLFPKDFGYLICSAKAKSLLSEKIESVGVVLDLLGEKPWEKEKRIQQTLEQLVLQCGKTITQNALQLLIESQDLDEGIIVREMEKLIDYTDGKSRIDIEDVRAICGVNQSYAVWQSAEKVVFEGTGRLEEDYFHILIPALRSQLQQGLKMAILLAENAPQEAWMAALPKVFPKTLEKRTKDAARLGVRYFVRGLETLFLVELTSRKGSHQLGALLDFFQCSLYTEASVYRP